jgi:hypothetical protein
MTVHEGPRADSRAYSVMIALIIAGGAASVLQLRDKCAATLAQHEFRNIVLGRLQRLGFVQVCDASVSITDAGRLYIHPLEVAPAAPRAPVASPYKVTGRELTKRVRQLPIRAGAFEYRDVPSRYGDQRVPFKVGYPGIGAAQE